ncbi:MULTISPECIES: HK97-gp10 family putative phage morphogenesis protein [Bacillus]|uniref:HK97 gp10 family phage protein n=1 Tax=Bacillus glycinifermentans TaxID=1664069 RepID=A0AAJ3Z0L6_9BACI|nr:MULTISPECIES: HK97-gp10 family putative phage morphogenesis protein [Bacillus]MBU8787138.1 HK97 gp10 family phage protein [Bacillus glycinifermentans]MDU0070035.1 HK97 gp10 family phage protein [Bacillus sp. IG6]MED8017708.1 HK97 gp10 family phage protein [Bacillus glycinifermentans]NUJ16165.1 HK97 gp10 family phage protein [Bacillus glycinifermentans]QAT66378.1 HK97 gp10 family phage protein [Bacillus glycinifermentans]
MAEVSGRWVRQMRRATDEFRNRVIDDVKQIVTDTAELIYSHAVLNAPTAMIDGGNLKNSIEIDYKDGGLTAVISVGASYAIYVEYGTGIYAEDGNGRKTPWVYYDTKLNQWVFTRGMRAQPFWNPAVDEGMRYFVSQMR